MTVHKGSCHCGAVEFEVEGDFTSGFICDCSLCKRKGAIMYRVPKEQFRLVRGEDALTLYQWNTRVAHHYFCKHCGIYTHHRRRSFPNLFGYNLGCLEGVNPFDLGEVPVFDGVNHPSDRQ